MSAYYGVSHIETIEQLPPELERGRAYFIDSEGYIVIDHGRGPIVYGNRPGPAGNISEPDDILGSGTFRNGSTFSVKIYTNYRYWNVRAFWDNTNYVIWRNIEITGANDVYLSDGNNIWWQ